MSELVPVDCFRVGRRLWLLRVTVKKALARFRAYSSIFISSCSGTSPAGPPSTTPPTSPDPSAGRHRIGTVLVVVLPLARAAVAPLLGRTGCLVLIRFPLEKRPRR